MGFINYNSHLRVALCQHELLRNRMWALRSLFYSVASLIRVIQIDELIEFVAKVRNYTLAKVNNKLLIESNIDNAALFLTAVRNELKHQKNEYDLERKRLKRINKRFPIEKQFDRSDLINIVQKLNQKE